MYFDHLKSLDRYSPFSPQLGYLVNVAHTKKPDLFTCYILTAFISLIINIKNFWIFFFCSGEKISKIDNQTFF